MNIKAFIDPCVENKQSFCTFLLSSPDFLSTTVKKFASYGGNKDSMAGNVAEELINEKIDGEDIILEFFKQPRQWFSYKLGKYDEIPKLDNPTKLLYEFGEEKWYGPIHCHDEDTYYFVRIYKQPYYLADNEGKPIEYNIRWSLIAKVEINSISLHWNGFSYNNKEKIKSHNQFPFWHNVPEAFEELTESLGCTYNDPVVHKLILTDIWEKYVLHPDYKWRHLAVRAESSGVNLSARSKGVTEIRVEGLLSLAKKISESVLKNMVIAPEHIESMIQTTEQSVLKTLIHEWGTKSYEFSLDHDEEKLFKAHCYFGFKPLTYTQDCFPHFKSFRAYGGASKALQFLLEHS